MTDYHLAQLNTGRIAAPLDSPQMHGFMSRLDEINALAEQSPGFIWRYQTEDGNATALRPFPDDDRQLVNFSVWTDAESLHTYVYRTMHVEVMKGRRQWFEPMAEAFTVLWWVPAGHRPTVQEAIERLMLLRRLGPTAEAFTFQHRFPPPGAATERPLPLADECPA